jgi:nicotinic acid phosphoribosyltransferase
MLMSDVASPLLTDLYQLNMIKAYLDHGQTADTFDLVVVG